MVFSLMKTSISISIIFLSLSFGIPTYAQTFDDIQSYDTVVNAGDFEFEMTPQNPGPYQQVSIRLLSDLVDTNRYPITWTVDGTVVASGIGTRSITITTKEYGQTVSVTMSIRLVDSTVSKQVFITPQDTTILWEAVNSYVPPFYQGKKLPSFESLVRVTAIPNFLSEKTSTATKNAVYNWSRADRVVPDGSGYGKDSLLIQHNRVRRQEVIEVTTSDVGATGKANAKTTISFFDPQILFYERDMDTGIISPLTKNSFYLAKKSTTIHAVPYFFSTNNNNLNSLKFAWTMNGNPISLSDQRKQNSLTVQNPDAAGKSTLGLSVENTSKLFQSSQKSLDVFFQKQ